MNKKKITIILISCVSLILVILAIFITINKVNEYKDRKEKEQLVLEYRDNKKKIYIEENEKYDDYEVDVAFLGDSLTDGCDINKYYPSYLAVNRGIGGDRTYDVLKRIDYSVYDLKPKVIVLLIGGNNLDTMFDDYIDILRGIKENLPLTKCILVSLTAMGGKYKDKNKIVIENNKKIEALAENYKFEYVEVFSLLYNDKLGEINPNYTTDGAHLTHEGYLILTGAVNERLKSLLK